MSDTTTPYQAPKKLPMTLGGFQVGGRVILTWTSGTSEGTAVGTLEAVHHEMEPHWRGGSILITRARLAGAPGYLTITGWGEAQPLEPNTTPSN